MMKYNVLLALAAALSARADEASQKPIGSDYVCEHPQYHTHIVSTSPLVIYLENFITAEERRHLLDIT